MAYDPVTSQLVLVGGIRVVQVTPSSGVEIETVLGDTWIFADDAWSPETSGPVPPVGKRPDVLAYDPGRKELILVTAPAFAAGTTHMTQRSTTWSWTGTHWLELRESGPDWGDGSALMAYDVVTHQLVFAPESGPHTYLLAASGWKSEPKSPQVSKMAYDPLTRRLLASAADSMWWWTGKHWRLLERRVVVRADSGFVYGMPESGKWVDDEAAGEILVFGDFPTAVGTPRPTNLFAWLGGTWRPLETEVNPAPDNPQNFNLAFDRSIGGIVAIGGDEGQFTSSGSWIVGGSSTWELVESQ